jgi:prepilin-type N-terminal cleavage/methylation domain-containing protein/prepilin-type processing-associated H-X9-DG protein
MTIFSNRRRTGRAGFTLMEVLVVIAIILVLAAIAVPTIQTFRMKAHKGEALRTLRDLGSAALSYGADHEDELPREDAKGSDSWQSAADPENKLAWYNALPAAMGRRTVADFANTPRSFYTKENMLFLPGATYPDSDKKLQKPLFAIAINTKLQRKDPDTGKKVVLKKAQIANLARTVLFLEQGLPSEQKTAAIQSNKDYDGSPKGSAKSFPGRYSGKGVLVFVDGHAEEADPKDLLTETGQFPFPPIDVIWCRTPEEDPNKK